MPSPVGHALGGLLVGLGIVSKLDRSSIRDLGVCAAVACLPDIDFLWGRHAMETHSIGAAALVGVATFLLTRRRDLTIACVLAWLSHVLFDWLGSDDFPPLGVMALWPLTSDFYFANAFIFEAISRRYQEPGFWEQNILALVKEIVMLVPPIAALYWWRQPETRRL
jgi:membrane-bound metal-dependent hydrolase YbcI (DUF457 family)